MRVVTDLVLENNSLLASHLLLLQTQNIKTIQRCTKTLIMTPSKKKPPILSRPSVLTVRPAVSMQFALLASEAGLVRTYQNVCLF